MVTAGAGGFTTTDTLAVASAVPAFEQVISKMYVFAVMPVRSSNPPVAVFAPLHQFDAVHESGEPVVVQVRRVAFVGSVRGPAGEAERVTLMAPMGVTCAETVAEFPPAFVQYSV